MICNRVRKLVVPALAGALLGLTGFLALQLSAGPDATAIAPAVAVATTEPAVAERGRTDGSAKQADAAAEAINASSVIDNAAVPDQPASHSTPRPRTPSAPEAAPAVTLDSTLLGIMTAGERRVAWMRDPRGEVVAVRVGERVQGWVVRAIEAEKVVLEGVQMEEIKLFPDPQF